ncbi:M1 family metallopeptidase [Candidatus Uhrbacteria bacterium]|nr:M1 family metallopeptidase [Candidatus Uhrbacteria bacterium]
MADQSIPNTRPDPHSYFRTDQPRLTHLDWTAVVDFASRTLECSALLKFDRSGVVDLDTRDLTLLAVTTPLGVPLDHEFAPAEPVIGSRLRVTMPDGTDTMRISYVTSPNASALQWLDAQQTAGKRHPFLFSQGECIHTRSFLPCQDSPGVRFTYTASLSVPLELRGLMAAARVDRIEAHETAIERWAMLEPIPAYLIALAVGELESRDLSPRSRVWAEPEVVEMAAADFRDVGAMMDVAESLYGPYDWERFDMLVLPPSFPYGGMENPRLTFLTPGIVTGDRSMVSVVGHELAHSWTGNLVTNATWRDFWLNEGWTTYVQWRIREALVGKDETALEMAILQREFQRDIEAFAEKGTPERTALGTFLPGTVDPDDTFSRVPYFKGALFFVALEQMVGRERFDAFIRVYIERFRFKSITTPELLDFIADRLPGMLEQVQAWRWVYEPWLPDTVPLVESPLIAEVSQYASVGEVLPLEEGTKWSDPQWILYLDLLPRARCTRETAATLDGHFHLSERANTEVRWSYLLLAIETGHTTDAVREKVERFLASQGRVKYLRPLYRAMAKTPEGLAWARAVFDRVKTGYHPIARSVIAKLLAEEPRATS